MSKTTKVPIILAKNELNDEQTKAMAKSIVPADAEHNNARSLTNFYNYFPYVFDGLCYLLSDVNYINGKHKNYLEPNGKPVDIIERKDNNNELFYKSMLPIDVFAKMCLGEHLDQWPKLLSQLIKVNDKPESKVIFYEQDDGTLVRDLTQPIRISFQHVTGRNLTPRELQYQKNFAQNGNINTQVNPIAYITIEYHKGWFKDLLHKNPNGALGWKYYRTAPHFTANLDDTVRYLLESKFFDTYKDGRLNAVRAPLLPSDARALYKFLLGFNNDTNEYIQFTTLRLCKECPGFGSYINRKQKVDGTITESVPVGRGYELRAKLEKIIVTMKVMAQHGYMDGSVILPYELDPNTVQYKVAESMIKIKILRPDKHLHFDVKQIPQL